MTGLPEDNNLDKDDFNLATLFEWKSFFFFILSNSEKDFCNNFSLGFFRYALIVRLVLCFVMELNFCRLISCFNFFLAEIVTGIIYVVYL